MAAANYDALKAQLSRPKGRTKVKTVMHEFKEGTLHSGSSKGPLVKNPKQAVAIALSEQRNAGRS
jgi:uncharacterized protein DUF6496